jgi:hypothetical protein
LIVVDLFAAVVFVEFRWAFWQEGHLGWSDL